MHKKATLENDKKRAEKGLATFSALDKVYSLKPSTLTTC